MVSVYTNHLRLEEIGTGEQSGDWGTTTNTNLELIAEAFSYGTEAIADANITLTMADGTSDGLRSFYVKITSSVDLTATRTITLAPNDLSKVWMIENATSGSQIITIKQGTGATVNIANGQVKMVATDGGEADAIVYDLLTDVELAGTTTATALTVDDVAIDGKVITMTGSSGDTATMTVGTNGTLAVTTTDGSAAAANITITADGTFEAAGTTVTLNSSGGITLDADGGTITFADAGSSLGTITSSGYSGTAAVATTVTITDNESTNENNAIIFTAGGDVDGGNIGLESDGNLTYNPSTGTVTATGFSGALGASSAAAATVTTLDTSGAVNLNLTTDSTSSTSGALIVDGGVGVAKKLFVGTDFDVSGNTVIDGTGLVTGVLTTTATQVATGGITSGSNIVSDTDGADDLGTTSVRWANLYVDAITATDQITATGFTGTLDGILGSGSAAAATVTTLDTSGAVNLNLTTDSTSSTSGALIVDGGVGVAKKLFVGTDLTVGGDLTISGDDLIMGTNTAGMLLIADGTNFNPTLVTSLSEISTAADDDVLIAIDTSGGGLKKISRSAIIAGTGSSGDLANVVEDTSPQLGGNLDVQARAITTSTSNGNIALTPNGTGVVMIDGNVGIDTGKIDLKNGGTASQILFYCESSNAHAQTLQAAPHSQGATNTLLLPDGGNGTLLSTVSTATLTNKTFGDNTSFGDNNITNVGDIALDSISADGTDINVAVSDNSATALTIKQGSDAYLIIDTANSSESVSIGTGISGTAITLGHSTSEVTVADNLTVTGDLTVSGTTTTVNSTTVNLNDHNIVLDSGNDTSAVINGAGITIEGGSGDDATFTYNTTGPKFELKLGSAHEDLQVAGLIATTGVFSGILKSDDTTDATSTTDGSLQTDGGLSVAKDAVLGNDVKLLSDAAVLSFGANSEVTLTHVHNDGLLLNADNQLQFRDSAINIRSDADGDLDINADDEIELNSTLIDVNGNLDVSGTIVGASTLSATTGTFSGILKTDDATDATSTTDGSLQTDGGLSVAKDAIIGNDLKLLSDSAVLVFGAGSDATLTHTNDVGLTLNSTNKLMFNDASQFIQGASATVLDIAATDEIELTATLIDVVGNFTNSGTLVSTGKITADAGIDIDNFNIDGTTIALSSGNMTIDSAAGDIILEGHSNGTVQLHKQGTQYGTIYNGSNDLTIQSVISDKDIVFRGNDGGSDTEVLRLDMSDGGAATFNNTIKLGNTTLTGASLSENGNFTFDMGGNIILDADGGEILLKDGGTEFGNIFKSGNDLRLFSSISDGDMVFRGNDGGSNISALTLDMSAAGAATFNNNVTAFSDRRLKSDIQTIENGLEKVEQLRGVTYTRDDNVDGGQQLGVIAQEVEEVFPQVVLTANDERGTKSVDYGRLTGALIEAVKELSAKVKELEGRLDGSTK